MVKREDLAYGEDVWEGEEVWRIGEKVKKDKGSCLSETDMSLCQLATYYLSVLSSFFLAAL